MGALAVLGMGALGAGAPGADMTMGEGGEAELGIGREATATEGGGAAGCPALGVADIKVGSKPSGTLPAPCAMVFGSSGGAARAALP